MRDILVPFKVSMQISNTIHLTTLTWDTVIGKNYQPQFQTNLSAPWSSLGSLITATNLTTSVTDSYTSGIRYYRLLQVN